MKHFAFIIALLSMCNSLNAQKFLRYTMTDGSFNGFFTENIDSVVYDMEDGIQKSFTHIGKYKYPIATNSVERITFENTVPSLNDHGGYKLYEFNNNGNGPKKMFVDSRAILCASQNGDFGVCDTIFFCSAYHNLTWIFITDSVGQIKKFFDGADLYYMDYDVEHGAKVIAMSTEGYEVFGIEPFVESEARKLLGISSSQLSGICKFLKKCKPIVDKLRSEVIVHEQEEVLMFGAHVTAGMWYFNNFMNYIGELDSNPELRNQCLVVDAASIGMDIVSIIGAIAAIPATGGLSIAVLIVSLADLAWNGWSMCERLWPSTKQMAVYKDYYKNKYGLNIETMPATDILITSARLNGSITSQTKLKGNLYFEMHPLSRKIEAESSNAAYGVWTLAADVTGLEPGKEYSYEAGYSVVIDGLNLVYEGETCNFTTESASDLVEIVGFEQTGAEYSPNGFTSGDAVFSYRYTGATTVKLKEGTDVAEWGYVYVALDGSDNLRDMTAHGSSYTDENYAYYRNASRSTVTLKGYVKFSGSDNLYFSDEKTFPLKYIGSPTTGTAVDLGLSVRWADHNVGATNPEDYGSYYSWGEISEKDCYSWNNYAYPGHGWYTGDVCADIGDNISGSAQYDAARVEWGGSWRMPTWLQVQELFSKCTWKDETLNGVKGARVTGSNGNSIFIPHAGYYHDTTLISENSGHYWTGTYYGPYGWSSYNYYSYKMSFTGYYKQSNGNYYEYKQWGLPIRPVCY